jgi:hypothetical protein
MKKNWTMKYMLRKTPFKSKKRRKQKQKIPIERESEKESRGHTVVTKRAEQERVSVLDFVFQQT